jgi:spermidine synthase
VRAHNWMVEFRPGRSNMYRLEETLVSTRSAYQEILIGEVQGIGRALFLDGIPQSSALDEHIYHETLIHPALAAHKHPRSVFVAGGGEGAVLREILKHNTVERLIMVDIDDVLLGLVRTYLPNWHQGLMDDPRVQVIAGDARAYLENTQERFDCIIMDLTDPFEEGGLSTPLFSAEFFRLASSRLTDGGVLSMQAETTDYGDYDAHVKIIKTLQNSFTHVLPYAVFLPFYGLPWGYAVASNSDLSARFAPQTLTQTLAERGCTQLRFYDAETHQNMFSLPKHIRDALHRETRLSVTSESQKLSIPRPASQL